MQCLVYTMKTNIKRLGCLKKSSTVEMTTIVRSDGSAWDHRPPTVKRRDLSSDDDVTGRPAGRPFQIDRASWAGRAAFRKRTAQLEVRIDIEADFGETARLQGASL